MRRESLIAYSDQKQKTRCLVITAQMVNACMTFDMMWRRFEPAIPHFSDTTQVDHAQTCRIQNSRILSLFPD